MVKIASGRDAADAAVASIFGNAFLTSQMVGCEVLDASFNPLFYDHANAHYMAY